MKLILLIAFFSSYLFANTNKIFTGATWLDCPFDYGLLRLIATAERHAKRDIGYPYLISFNNPEDSGQITPDIYNYIKLDNRTIDCLNYENCIHIANTLLEKQIYNIDFGGFQLNYRFNKIETNLFFEIEGSYRRACNNLVTLVNNYGYSWETIAKYHSFTKKHNIKYQVLLKNLITKEINR
jgi:hypothetical protein